MKWLCILCLAGCATVPEPVEPHRVHIAMRFVCIDNNLVADFLLDSEEHFVLVGRCLGDLQIIGKEQGQDL